MAESSSRQRGRHGDGTIYTTADGRLRAAVTVPHALTGEPVRRYLSARTDAEIKRKLKDARAERATGGRTPTVAIWGERWLALVAHRVRPSTLNVYRVAIRRHVIPALGRVELGRLRPSDVEMMTSRMIDAGSSPSTAALARTVFVVCLTDAARDGLIARNVAQLARAPRTAEPFRRALAAEPTSTSHRDGLSGAIVDLGNAAFDVGDMTSALHWYREAITLDPNDPMAWHNLALVFERVTGASPKIMSSVAMVATLDGVIVQIILASRVLYGLSSEGQVPGFLASINAKTRTPVMATIVTGGWCCCLHGSCRCMTSPI